MRKKQLWKIRKKRNVQKQAKLKTKQMKTQKKKQLIENEANGCPQGCAHSNCVSVSVSEEVQFELWEGHVAET